MTKGHAKHMIFITNRPREENMLETNEFMATRCFKSNFKLFIANSHMWNAGDTVCCACINMNTAIFHSFGVHGGMMIIVELADMTFNCFGVLLKMLSPNIGSLPLNWGILD
jgi:hypothetical protein